VAAAPANPAWLVSLGNFIFRTRDGLFSVVLVALVLLTAPVIPGGDVRLARLLDVAGLLVAVAGQALRVAVIGYRYIVRGGRNRQVHANELVTSGLFGISRNPLYVGNLLLLAGIFIIWNSPWMYAIGVPFFLLAYRAIVAAEEAYLGRQYGEAYARYVAQTPRWWPRLAGAKAATAGIPFNWRRVVLKEYGTTAFWVVGATLILRHKAVLYAALTGGTAITWPYWTVVAVVVVLWSWARYLKKSRRLTEQ
jgi:protein-S-isoprenylcysteine O-methyltransferase Ste14